MPLARALVLRLAHALQNTILNLEVEDFQSSFRVYAREALQRIPWQLNSDLRFFDDEVLVQLRALDESIVGVSTGRTWEEHAGILPALAYSVQALQVPIGYRLHQLHFTRHHQYMVDRDIHYTLKMSPTGSHMQTVEAIEPGSRVLDLGCSQGLLARPLRERGVRVTGVDARPPEGVAEELESYYQRDLEQELQLPEERDFDYVVVADVIEHIRNRRQLLRSVRRYLKSDGRLIISTPNIAIWFYRLSLLVGRFEYGPRGVLDADHVHLYTRATFQREVEGAGFRVVKRRVTALPFEVVFEATGRSRVVRRMADLYYSLAKAWPSMFAYQHILEAEITTLDEESTSAEPE
jgi:methionine biosynthesis protein MetW